MDWLRRAQRNTGDGGLSYGYSLSQGRWLGSYPETTGYVIPTFFDYARLTGENRWIQRAEEMGKFLLALQDPEGAFPGGLIGQGRGPSVFNSGQIVKGLCRLVHETRDKLFAEAVRRASRWIVSVQDPDGAWRKFTYLGHVHSYYAMVAWALLDWDHLEADAAVRSGAERHATWVVQQQRENGWFDHSAFENEAPYTHTIGYVLQGLLECGVMLNRDDWIRAVEKTAGVLMTKMDEQGRLSGQYDENWNPVGDYSCLTGNCQVAGVWLRLAEVRGRKDMAEAAVRALRYVASTQDLESRNDGIRGGIKGSHPVWGEYQTYTYPNWAAKFFCDALMMLLKTGRTTL